MKIEQWPERAYANVNVDESYDILQGWVICDCGERVFVILKSGETYPCPKCETVLEAKSVKT